MENELLIRINQEVNRDIIYMSDFDQYGLLEHWVVNPSSKRGDCEDYALTKLYRLVAAGFPASRCNIIVVRILSGDGAGQLHAILLIDGIWVLDNLRNSILRLDSLPYRVLSTYDRRSR